MFGKAHNNFMQIIALKHHHNIKQLGFKNKRFKRTTALKLDESTLILVIIMSSIGFFTMLLK